MALLIENGGRGFQRVTYNIHGFQQCCSAAILHGIGGYARTVWYPDKADLTMEQLDWEPVTSYDEYQERYSRKHTVFSMPYHHGMCSVLEGLYNKSRYGRGGHNMYASQRYATQTWFIADRRRTESSMSCLNFMFWLKDMGVSKVGRIHISPYRPGAHGGECKGAVFAPDNRKIERFLAEHIKQLNAHIEAVKAMYEIDPAQIKAYAEDEVAELW